MFMIVALVIEVCRAVMPVFVEDRQKWFDHDRAKGEEEVLQIRVDAKSST